MPLLAHFDELEPQERRRAARRALRLGVSGQETGDAVQEVTIHDLSLTGALLETSIPMLVGAIFEFELPQAGLVEAEIVWSSGEFYGAQFSLPITPAVLSAALLRAQPRPSPVSGRGRPRPPRAPGQVRTTPCRSPATNHRRPRS